MVLLENLDLNDLKLDQFKYGQCPCELCDDGCFDRRFQPHHPDCKKNLVKNSTKSSLEFKMNGSLSALSHYKQTFVGDYDARPATMCRPKIDSNYDRPQVGMDFNTIQKSDFTKPLVRERTMPIKLRDSYELSKEPFSGLTSYRAEYLVKENNGLADRVKKNSNNTTMKIPTEPLSSNTTNREFFKWKTNKQDAPYWEHPSLAGLALFPTKERQFTTHSGEIHSEFKERPKKSILTKADIKGSIQLEGEMDLATNYRDTYVKFNNPERVKKIVRANTIVYNTNKSASLSESQTKSDFVPYLNHAPSKPADCNPYISNLNQQIYPGNKYDLSTMYSSEFVNFNPDKIEKAKSFKANEVYKKPEKPMATETVTQRDFKPIDITKVPMLKACKINNNLKLAPGPMETKTSAMLQFIAHDVKPITLAKDWHPEYYIPKTSKFPDVTTNKETFKGEKGFRSKSFKPDYDNIKIEKSEKLDQNTIYRDSFIRHGLTMCESKAYLIAKSAAEKRSSTQSNSINSNENLKQISIKA